VSKKIKVHQNLARMTGTLHKDVTEFNRMCLRILLGIGNISETRKLWRKSKHTFYAQ